MPKKGMVVHSVLFDKTKFSASHARAWLAKHNYKPIKPVHTTEHQHRFRIVHPSKFEQKTFKTIHISDGITAVVGKLL